ncbi:MAG: putative metal-binding motif-containing protein, partial [Myxococcota bacterium]|nr:putative metal-binding motif-containing protein [Myxococcota bacterium]
GDSTRPQTACLVPAGYVDDDTDCNDAMIGVNPGATEDCLTADDDDCDGTTNTPNAIACSTFYYDEDGDNYGIADSACLCAPEAPYQAQIDTDCDDSNVDINPGELENCSTPEDDNCNGDTNDEGASFCTYFYYDEDGDNYGLTQTSICVCTETGYYRAESPNDCDDTDQTVNPAQVEVCDPDDVDENCDGLADDATAIGAQPFYVDIDSDGYGDSTPGLVLNDGRSSPMVQCDLPQGFAGNGDDCNDQQVSINPGMPELCSSSFDDDCDGDDNDEDAVGCDSWYADVDLDGHGSVSDSKCYCDNRDVYTSASGTDCDDGDPLVNPDQSELCATSADDNCDSQINENLAADCTQYFLDEDGDGWGVYDFICACQPQQGYEATQMGDCNDDPSLNGVGQNPDIGNCGLSGAFDTGDAVATLASGYFVLDQSFDYNQDGFSDVLIGKTNSDNIYTRAGEAQIIFGPLNGELGNANDADLYFSPTITFDERAGLYGAVGDWNGDGAPEWLVGSPNRIYLFPSEMTITQPFEEEEANVILFPFTDIYPGYYAYEAFEQDQSVPMARSLGDLNGDGRDELSFGRNFLSIEHDQNLSSSARISANSDGESESYILWDGADISTVSGLTSTISALRPCDIDGDGQAELVGEYRHDTGGHQYGTPWYAPKSQALQLYSAVDLRLDPAALPIASVALDSNHLQNSFGQDGETTNDGGDTWVMGLGCVGDLDGDGAEEIAITKPIQNVSVQDPFTGGINTTSGQGHVRIWQGGLLPDSSWAIEDFDTQIIGASEYDFIGRHLSNKIDLNGDNKDDLVISGTCYRSDGKSYQNCPGNNFYAYGGDTYLFYGGFPMGATYSNLDADGFLEGYTGPMYSAGDTNGDGADDLWIGNLLFMGTPF